MAGSEGQDWASYQDWSPSTKGLGFVFVKGTEGTAYTNPRYSSQIAAVRAGDALPGHYHFARPGSMPVQGAYFLKRTTIKPGDVIALDWEDTGVTSADKDAWIRYVQDKAPGHKVGLYCNRDFWLNRDHSGFYGDFLWIADPNAPKGQPGIKADWLFHQYSEAGGIDRNYCHLTAVHLKAWAAGTTPSPLEDDVSAMDVLTYRNPDADEASVKATGKHIPDFYGYVVQTNSLVKAQGAAINTLAKAVGDLHPDVDTQTLVAAVQQAIADAVVHVSVDVNTPTTT